MFQIIKEILVAVFFDIEKAYDMMWRDGLMIKVNQMGIKERMYRWIKTFKLIE